jgi:hypothetical protein
MGKQNLSNGIDSLIQSDDDAIRGYLLASIKNYPKRGLYQRLLSEGMNVSELNFANAKAGRGGYKNNLKILAALAKLPTTAAKLSRAKLQKQ